MTMKLLLLDHFEYETNQTNVWLCGLYHVSFKEILIGLTTSMGVPNFVRLLYSTSLQTELQALLKVINR
jgi:hypothetical protein